MKNKPSNTRGIHRIKRKLNAYVDRAVGGVALIAVHEANALRGHVSEVSERLRVARRARGVKEIVRDQVDLLPESRNRIRRDHEVRMQLCRGLIRDLTPRE